MSQVVCSASPCVIIFSQQCSAVKAVVLWVTCKLLTSQANMQT